MPKSKPSSLIIYLNDNKIGLIRLKTHLVTTLIVNYSKAPKKLNHDLYLTAGYLDSKKVHHSVILPLDIKLKPGDQITVTVT